MNQQGGAPQRIPGCESTNHDQCYGELWQCSACGKTVCSAEGTDDRPDLCDDCWMAQHRPPSITSNEDENTGQSGTEPTVAPPDMETLEVWIWEGICEATDGCICEPDGHCVHGFPSWLLELGLI